MRGEKVGAWLAGLVGEGSSADPTRREGGGGGEQRLINRSGVEGSEAWMRTVGGRLELGERAAGAARVCLSLPAPSTYLRAHFVRSLVPLPSAG